MSKYNKKLFKYWKGWESQAIISVTMVQFLLIINTILVVNLKLFNGKERKFSTYEVLIFLVLFFGLDYYNNKLYKGRYEEFDLMWGNDSPKKKIINMIVITSIIILAWGLVFINAWLFGRFKVVYQN